MTRRSSGLRLGWSLWLGPCLVIAASGLVLLSDGETGLVPLARLGDQLEQARGRARALEREQAELLQAVRGLRGDDEAVEAVAREQLGMVRPGEVVIRWEPARGSVDAARSD